MKIKTSATRSKKEPMSQGTLSAGEEKKDKKGGETASAVEKRGKKRAATGREMAGPSANS